MSLLHRSLHHLHHHKPTITPLLLLRHLTTTTPSHPSSAHYDSLIHSAAAANDLPLLARVLSDRISSGFFNTTHTFSFLTSTPSSLSLLPDLLHHLSLLPPGLPRKNALDSLLSRLSKLRLPHLALHLLDQMRHRKLEFSTTTFHPILNALSRARDFHTFRSVIRLMNESKTPPDTTSYNFLLTALSADGDVDAAADLLVEMRELGLKADARTYDAMVLGLCRAGRVDGAVAVMRAVLGGGEGVMLYSTPVHVVTALMERGRYEEAVKVGMACGEGRDGMLGSECCGVVASRLVRLERVEMAMFVLGEMERRGFKMEKNLSEFYSLHLYG